MLLRRSNDRHDDTAATGAPCLSLPFALRHERSKIRGRRYCPPQDFFFSFFLNCCCLPQLPLIQRSTRASFATRKLPRSTLSFWRRQMPTTFAEPSQRHLNWCAWTTNATKSSAIMTTLMTTTKTAGRVVDYITSIEPHQL